MSLPAGIELFIFLCLVVGAVQTYRWSLDQVRRRNRIWIEDWRRGAE